MRYVMLFLAGLSIGWLGGLSESPVASSLLTAIVAAVVGAASTLLRPAKEGAPGGTRLDATTSAAAITFVVLGMAFGVPAGIVVRAHAWLGPAAESASNKEPAADAEKTHRSAGGVGWYDKITDSCAELRKTTDRRAALSRRGEAGDRVIAACNGGDACLQAVIDLVCSDDAAGSPSR
ncbi:MAG TPA: hypothetical protein VIG99_14675 [Myxococcaceae bacterium]|jgi:cytochrome P450